ncbi:hypothetical protein B0H19DRAFT_1380980 [Mycena capillaripes]|nr:hypothetical protein B0H19DRAFT_1380980 [Mycena capillaripes]
MSAETSARASVSSHPLRRRIHLLERASRSFTTADSSTRNGDVDDHSEDQHSLPSPPTSYETEYDDDDEEEEQGLSGDDDIAGTPKSAVPIAEPREEEEGYHTPEPLPWYKPSVPVLLALAPPIGNWLTGGDHLKDLLLLLLLVFYLHQLVEVPWGLYHGARPRRTPPLAAAGAPTQAAARAASELRLFELALLLLCLLTPALGVFLLRSLALLTSSPPSSSASSPPAEPISWFSTTLFFLLTSFRPLRELTQRITSRTSTLHARVHAHTAPAPPDPQLAELRAHVARLEEVVKSMVEREDAVYAYVEDALAPLEKGVRRVERRVGKLRGAKKNGELAVLTAGMAGATNKTIFVHAAGSTQAQGQTKYTPQALIASWFTAPTRPAPPPTAAFALPSPGPISPTAGKRRALDSIPEEGEPSASASSSHSSAFVYPPTTASPAHRPADVGTAGMGADVGPGAVLALLAALVRQWLAAGLALALYPLYLVLLPVRGALRVLVGVV